MKLDKAVSYIRDLEEDESEALGLKGGALSTSPRSVLARENKSR